MNEHKTHSTHQTSEPPRDRQKEKTAQIEEGLEAIYGSDEMDFTKLEKTQNRLTRILFISVIVLSIIAITAWSGFFVYTKFFETNHDESFALAIEMNKELVSGQKTSIDIVYSNPTTVPIAALQIDVNLPSSFKIENTSQSPTDAEKLIWDIGELAGLSDNKITIDGVWIAEVPSETPVQVYANFRPANFNADFKDIDVKYVTTISSALSTTVTGAEEASPGDTVTYEIKIENTSEQILENILVKLDLPDGFYLEESEPAVEAGVSPEWTVASLEAAGTSTITFSGSFAADIEGFQYFDVDTAIATEQRDLVQNEVQAYTDVLASDFSVQLVANGSSDSTAVELGSNLRLSLAYENTGAEEIDGVSLLLDFQAEDSIPINWNNASLDGGVITRDGIVWSASTLGEIPVSERKTLNLTFPIDNSLGVGDTDSFTIIAEASGAHGIVKSSPIIVSVNSEAELEATIRYYDDEGNVLGNGPLPPAVGETTTYRVYWTINNSVHNLENIKVTATLPPHVDWFNQTDSDLGSFSYESSSKTITWNITNISTDVAKISANFAISATPDIDDIGSFIKMISSSSLSAKDSETGETLTDSVDSLSTDLEADEFATGKGAVVE
ncbi:hypothetical protein CO057_01600 [Candidatus Uhrbacteria bacterium CG_4_9_14_0_2_um_filter_41_50]|uniref:DUF11 domain-containing protein n=1 Tax=Candidatus Uhrbacteria bacterium CG_4_9_14_0_2_um_filter_41_50 TaxID=1975031 RepID=A0A2M8EPN6_9BACT|nr:MAG: hypothetical protein COZ45_00110 [Candidatus Uhrbacteria bacterium CG_4_10_14_3_um_filter_41_21]PIZ54848.1 MAG: hypothetical protein COY24_02440 [Candidatus Uhrbacteria bacterium CG_4_10_14_0_2_um_filter_41_21]PJB84338.1 MAG: hypothetical protein CO086_04190 [Candidatus Uhrbacteria bacterium CG_4_9_14_0_8_um_filter_41_16]PJC24684.1 MAG: hypothetical protein CO057_01600 [Candidatus Uhrbacteria bacterium CG_4_9_14_0_2_um_filter_41_50]PJE75073.1 MAG: hypothetical protein COV03_02125 [Candi